MQKKTAQKYGFFMCFCMVVGTVVGTGIFFKNEGVYGLINGNGVLGLIAWIIGGIMALSFGLSFMEISSAKQDSNSGIALYAKMFGGKWFGRVVRNAMNHIYIPLTTFTVAYYTTKASIWAFGGGLTAEIVFSEKVGGYANYQLILTSFSIIYTVLLIYICTYLEKTGKYIQMTTVVLKLIPLILIGLIGMLFFNNDPNALSKSGLGDPDKYKLVANKTGFEMILMALPGILFSFDGFLSTTYIQKDVKKPERNIPLALVLGLASVTILYLLVSIGTLNLDAKGSVAVAAGKIFSNPVINKIFEWIIFFFILISAFGTLNGYSFSLVKLSHSSIEDNFIIGAKLWNKIMKKYSINFAIFLASVMITLIWGLIMGIPIIFAKETYNFYDFISNAGVVMAFLMYGTIIALGIWNRYHQRIATIKNWYFLPAAFISALCIISIIGYNIYSYFLNAIVMPEKTGPILAIALLLLILVLPWFGIWMKDNDTINKKLTMTMSFNDKNSSKDLKRNLVENSDTKEKDKT
ncbi:APC family permease [Spiroplasma phoeniceum]|uniref:Amino acid permease n=1 Tax=Spiroplasma phoeniceum P40 TaxID=1276259 RepID=A0A345DRS6_9MOLU|nr:APC family permease [Spiroplasma phoeniceum]AXF96917.1 amino acid permease [Spiroplasma phoeniceum P40]